MTHEMVHLAFPSVPDEHHWIEEGIATYVEPIARAQVGDLSPEIVWRELVDGLPKGLPAPGDHGLDNTHTWGRTYWGGALFCLMADIEIHRRTNNHSKNASLSQRAPRVASGLNRTPARANPPPTPIGVPSARQHAAQDARPSAPRLFARKKGIRDRVPLVQEPQVWSGTAA